MPNAYAKFQRALKKYVPAKRIYTDALRTLSFGHDASLYSLTPKMVVKVESETEVIALLTLAGNYQLPVTFRAAGTSLSGQAITDSILVVLGDRWRDYQIINNGALIELAPGLRGAEANLFLAPFKRKIGPDPASIESAKIGGIAANNASGMCCGTRFNSYHTLENIRIVFSDGSVLDTKDEASCTQFKQDKASWCEGILHLQQQIKNSPELTAKITAKYQIKNTMGYSLNAFLDFTDPVDIIAHLLIGSEGTLGFISKITYQTVPDYAHKAASLLVFDSVEAACQAVIALKMHEVPVIELMDFVSLMSIRDKPVVKEMLGHLTPQQCAILLEVQAERREQLLAAEQEVARVLSSLALPIGSSAIRFANARDDSKNYQALWDARKGVIASIAALRPAGTALINEDIAVPLPHLSALINDLYALFKTHGYEQCSIFGHAKDGNIHFLLATGFETKTDIDRYARFMNDLTDCVVKRYQGSLKAEHGTGRNMAAFLEKEWGNELSAIMQEIKTLLDPKNILNRGVLLNADPLIHLKNLKKFPPVDALIDDCIECGFCEKACPSTDLTLTPRQRIVALRHFQNTRAFKKMFRYQAVDTCAATGLCSERCPVGINTGEMVKKLRAKRHSASANFLSRAIARHFALVSQLLHWAAPLLPFFARARPPHPALRATFSLKGRRVRNDQILTPTREPGLAKAQLIYFPSCVSRTFQHPYDQESLPATAQSILEAAGFEVIVPADINQLCCGLSFSSKGFFEAAKLKIEEVKTSLFMASAANLPIVCDTASCALILKTELQKLGLKIYEIHEFLDEFAFDTLKLTRQAEPVMLHVTCSTKRMGTEKAMINLAKRCANEVITPPDVNCCGFAGDRGMSHPELNAHALRHLKDQIPANCTQGFSNNLPCEAGLAKHSGISYQSLLYLIKQRLRDPKV